MEDECMTENLFKQLITLKDRNYLEADKVDEVLVFDDSSVVLAVGNSELIIGGSGLTIIALDSEKKTIAIKGLIDAVVFGERNTKKGFFSRLFS
jgi:hypothetical protein